MQIQTREQAIEYAKSLTEYMLDNEEKTCLCCMASMSRNDHSLTRGMVRGLTKFARACIALDLREANPREAIENNSETLDLDERSNWTKLRFFGLVAKYKENGVHKDGKWVITRNGWAFLRGELAVPRHIYTFRNKIVEKSDDRVFFVDLYGSQPNFPHRDDLFHQPVEGEDIDIVRVAKKVGRKKRRKNPCQHCDRGEIKTRQQIVFKENVAVIVGHTVFCNRCEWSEYHNES